MVRLSVLAETRRVPAFHIHVPWAAPSARARPTTGAGQAGYPQAAYPEENPDAPPRGATGNQSSWVEESERSPSRRLMMGTHMPEKAQ